MSRPKTKIIVMKALMGLALTVVVFLIVEGICWVCGVKPLFLTRDSLVGFEHGPSLFTAGSNGMYATRPGKLRWFNHQEFPVKKGEDTYRIFCMGGSTTYGRPYDDKVSFSGYLRALLNRVDEEREWEVINAGGISYASYRVVRLMQELVDYEPDLFIVYCGHNEFLEDRTYSQLKDQKGLAHLLRAAMMRLRLYAVIDRIVGRSKSEASRKFNLGAEVQATLDDVVGPSAYERDDEQAQSIVDHYRVSIERMISLAQNAGAEIVFVMPASNLKDMSPFKSEHSPGYRPGDDDPRYAMAQYERGLKLFRAHEYSAARSAFTLAVDEDVCPLRMISALKNALRTVCRERGVKLIDYESLLETDCKRQYGYNILGREYFYDHVHPRLDATSMLSVKLLETLCRMGVLEWPDYFDSSLLAEIRSEVSTSLTSRERASALINLAKVLAWAGKFTEAEPVIKQAITALPGDGEAWFLLGLIGIKGGDKEAAMACFLKAVELAPEDARAHNNLGRLLLEKGDFVEAEKHFRESIRLEPGQVQAHYNLGNMLAARKDFVAAEGEYRLALKVSPDHVMVLGNLANVLGGQGRWKEAISVYERVLKINPDDPAASRNLVVARKMADR